MKKYTFLLLFILSTTLALAQKKEKIKGSKTVTTEQRKIGNFDTLEVEDNLEVYLEKSEETALKIEADDNLHDIIKIELRDNVLHLYTSKEATQYKKLIVKLSYTADLNLVIANKKSQINAIQEINLEDITIKAFDNSRLFLNVNSTNFLLQADDDTKMEINLKSEKAKIELSKNANLKALITTVDLGFDLYQKSEANIEGDATNAIIRMENNSNFNGKKLSIKNVDLSAESSSSCSINTLTSIIINAGDKSSIQLYGNPKIEITKFSEEAKLFKKIK
ncbi:GIN domain-containing protein [Flavobacterium acetivorans]|uniref:GIN domain-containing protein n=1 Tax=Flavobacterium acetivorans TaxID=2893883 RepID=UPI001E2BCDC7|nr:DUF2807 domain-containing protein [Flavobacterium sp. F-29]UFH35607.1 DUF2807 domain-containing protein [Flavobacterium sp. F-29]